MDSGNGYVRILYLEEAMPRRAVVEVKRKARKNNVEPEERVYLVLRVCRVCNHRGTAKRPSTPSHSASRHSIFFSLRPLRLPPSPSPGARASLFPGPNRPRVPFFFFPRRSSLSPALRRITSMRPFYNHYRLSQLDHRCAGSLSVFTPSAARFPRSCLFTSASLARIPLLSITD